MKTCSLCGREDPKHSIELTPDECQVLGLKHGTVYYYCDACWFLLQSKESAAQLLVGNTRKMLAAVNASNAEEIANKLLEYLRNA